MIQETVFCTGNLCWLELEPVIVLCTRDDLIEYQLRHEENLPALVGSQLYAYQLLMNEVVVVETSSLRPWSSQEPDAISNDTSTGRSAAVIEAIITLISKVSIYIYYNHYLMY